MRKEGKIADTFSTAPNKARKRNKKGNITWEAEEDRAYLTDVHDWLGMMSLNVTRQVSAQASVVLPLTLLFQSNDSFNTERGHTGLQF